MPLLSCGTMHNKAESIDLKSSQRLKHPMNGAFDVLAVSVSEGITKEHLQEVYSDSYIAKASHDHRAWEPIEHPLVTYLSAWVDGRFAGAFMAVRQTKLEFDLHALLKREFVAHSRRLGDAFISWAFAHSEVQRITAPVIESLAAAKNYCLKLGFKSEGFKHDCVQINGQLMGVHILGMTRAEWSQK